MIGHRAVEGFDALTIAGEDGELEAGFVPRAGMVGCSLTHRREELLGRRGGLRSYVAERSTMGIPLLHPWANRLARRRFELLGRQVDLSDSSLPLSADPNGLPIHGLLAGAERWRVERHERAGAEAVLAASFDFAAEAALIRAFPFPHRVELEARLSGTTLTIATSVRATGEVEVPISFGFHPYFRLPGLDRSAWEIEVPVSERLALDAEMLPTGGRERVAVEPGPLGSRTFDDAYVAPADSRPLVLAGGGRRIEVRFESGYPYAQVYAPLDDDVVAFEPMTTPSNALVDGGSKLPVAVPGADYRARFSVRVIDAPAD